MAKKAKLFQTGGSQAVRLPAEFRFEGEEVQIEKVGNAVVLRPVVRSWADFFADPARAPEDFLADRADAEPQVRDLF